MREIKFRFWNRIGKSFKYSWRYNITHDGKLLSYDPEMMDYDEEIEFEKTIIAPQQYTGLKDKNGKEIYEGDILLSVNETKVEFLYLIEFQQGTFRNPYLYRRIKDSKVSEVVGRAYNIDLSDKEIIGNIFENPDLLNNE